MRQKILHTILVIAFFGLTLAWYDLRNGVKNLEDLLSQCESQRTAMLERIIELYDFYMREST
jgi:hypothetical protein